MQTLPTNDELEKIRPNFSRCANRELAPLRKTMNYETDRTHLKEDQ